MKFPKMFFIYLAIAFPVIMFCLFSMFSGKVNISLSGFAVDSTGKMYLGKDSAIEVYEGDTFLYSISPKTLRGYCFTIQPNDTILLSTSTSVYVLDIKGSVISQEEDVGTKVFNSLQQNMKTFNSIDGHTYQLKSPWGRTQIVCIDNGNIIYRMPIYDYIVRILVIFYMISMFICIPIIIKKWRKQNGKS